MDNLLKALTTLDYLRLFAGPDQVYQMYAHCPNRGEPITMKSVNRAQAIAPHHEFITSGTLEPLSQCEDGTVFFHKERKVYVWLLGATLLGNVENERHLSRLMTRDWVNRQIGHLSDTLNLLDKGIY